MKKSILKLASLMLVVVLIACCSVTSVSAAPTQVTKPTVTITGNNENPAVNTANTAAGITITVAGLSNVKGIDVSVSTPANVSFNTSSFSGKFYKDGAEVSALNDAFQTNDRYTVTSDTVRIVCSFVQNPADYFVGTINLSTTQTAITEYTLSVSASYIVDEKVTIMTSGSYVNNNGKFIVAKTSPTNTTTSPTASSGCFIPYGSVYKTGTTTTYADKSASGTFTLTGGGTYQYVQFKNPTNGITTFATSKTYASEENNGIQFASYATDAGTTGVTHGTLLFKGDFAGFCKVQLAKYATQQDVIQRVMQLLTSNSRTAGKWYKISYKALDGTTKNISFAYVNQAHKMWINSGETNLEYALRVYNVNNSDTFTAVGFSKNGSTYTFSNEIKTTNYTNG